MRRLHAGSTAERALRICGSLPRAGLLLHPRMISRADHHHGACRSAAAPMAAARVAATASSLNGRVPRRRARPRPPNAITRFFFGRRPSLERPGRALPLNAVRVASTKLEGRSSPRRRARGRGHEAASVTGLFCCKGMPPTLTPLRVKNVHHAASINSGAHHVASAEGVAKARAARPHETAPEER